MIEVSVSNVESTPVPSDQPWRQVDVACFGTWVAPASTHQEAMDLLIECQADLGFRPQEQFDFFHTSNELPPEESAVLNLIHCGLKAAIMPRRIFDYSSFGYIPDVPKPAHDAPVYTQLRAFDTNDYRKFV